MSKPPYSRKQRLEQQIKRELAETFVHGLNDPRLSLISVTKVELSNDLKIAWVYYTSIQSVTDENAKNDAKKAIAKATPYIRHLFAQNVKLKYIPELRFVYDDNIEYAVRLDQIIKKIHEKDE